MKGLANTAGNPFF